MEPAEPPPPASHAEPSMAPPPVSAAEPGVPPPMEPGAPPPMLSEPGGPPPVLTVPDTYDSPGPDKNGDLASSFETDNLGGSPVVQLCGKRVSTGTLRMIVVIGCASSSGPVKPLHKLSSPPCPSAASPWSLSQSWQRPPAPVRKLFSSSLLTLHRLVLSRLLCAAGDDGATADDGAVPLQQAAAGSGPRLECPPGQGPNAARTACEPCGVSPNARLLPAVSRRRCRPLCSLAPFLWLFEPFGPVRAAPCWPSGWSTPPTGCV